MSLHRRHHFVWSYESIRHILQLLVSFRPKRTSRGVKHTIFPYCISFFIYFFSLLPPNFFSWKHIYFLFSCYLYQFVATLNIFPPKFLGLLLRCLTHTKPFWQLSGGLSVITWLNRKTSFGHRPKSDQTQDLIPFSDLCSQNFFRWCCTDVCLYAERGQSVKHTPYRVT